MKAILINATKKTIEEVDVPSENTLKTWYSLIGCNLVTCAFYINETDSVLVDDEGLLKQPQHFFTYEGFHQPLAGSGLVVGCDEEGETTSVKTTLEEVREKVKFMDIVEVLQYITANKL